MFLRHPSKLLSAYIDGELDPRTDSQVASHLERCERCLRSHARIVAGARLAESLPAAPAPEGLLTKIERRMNDSKTSPAVRAFPSLALRWSVAAAAILLGILLWTLESARQARRGQALELQNYFDSVAKARPEKLASAIAAAPFGFTATPREQALRQAGIGLETARQPLARFELAVQRSWPMPGAVATELVYTGEGEAFSVFVAPNSLPVRPSAHELAESRIYGALCHKLEPSCATVVWFSGGRFQCVLISTFDDPKRIASIIDFFRATHEAGARRRSG